MAGLTFIRPIDKGGFGNVDVVADSVGTLFARKTFSQNQPLDADMLANVLKRFRREARIQQSIKHPNVVPILGGDFEADPPNYIMPLAESSLSDDLQRDRQLGGNFVAAISDIVAGLEELHSMQIYHRDLKPKNVLRFSSATATGNVSYYAISDFGLIAMKESRLSVLTKTGMAKGSDYYTAPEITQDLRSASSQSDIYSLGCILHDMVGTQSRVPCGEIREESEFGPILLGCTRKNPQQRFKSARAVLDAILGVAYVSQSAAPPPRAADFVAALSGTDPLDPKTWIALGDLLESDASIAERDPIFRALREDRLRDAFEVDAGAAKQIALAFTQWVYDSSFNFDYCDGLANRLEAIFEVGDFETKSEALMALLEMGTNHNRWYVERKFCRLCGPGMDDNLAKRLAVHFRIEGHQTCRSISHLEQSISVSRENLHPQLVSVLREICK